MIRNLLFGSPDKLEKDRTADDAVTTIQKCYRGFKARRQYAVMREATNQVERELEEARSATFEDFNDENVRKLKPKSEQLFEAVTKNKFEAVVTLLREASDPSNRKQQGVNMGDDLNQKTVLNLNWKEPALGETALIVAAKNGYFRICKHLLEYRGGPESQQDLDNSTEIVDVNLTDDFGCTPLMHAAMNGHLPILILLRTAGHIKASVYVKDHDSWSALLHAADCGHWHCIEFLQGENADIAVRSNVGDTALIKAANNNHLMCVKMLYDFLGGDIDTPNRIGNSPAMSAAFYGRIEVLEFLVSQGADTAQENMFGETLLTIRPSPLALQNYNGTEQLPVDPDRALDKLHEIIQRVVREKQQEHIGNDIVDATKKLENVPPGRLRELRMQMKQGGHDGDDQSFKERKVTEEEEVHDTHTKAKKFMEFGNTMFEMKEYEAAYIYYNRAHGLMKGYSEYSLAELRASTMYRHAQKIFTQEAEREARIQAKIFHENAKRYARNGKLKLAHWWISQALVIHTTSQEYRATYATIRHVRRLLASQNLNWTDVTLDDVKRVGVDSVIRAEFASAEKKFGVGFDHGDDDGGFETAGNNVETAASTINAKKTASQKKPPGTCTTESCVCM